MAKERTNDIFKELSKARKSDTAKVKQQKTEVEASNKRRRTALAAPLSIDDTSICPQCNETMPIMDCGGQPAHVCVRDRVALPVKTDAA